MRNTIIIPILALSVLAACSDSGQTAATTSTTVALAVDDSTTSTALTAPETTAPETAPETTVETKIDTSEQAAIERIAAGAMLPMDTMHMIANKDQMPIMLSNGDWGVPSLLQEEPIPMDAAQISRWAPHVNGGWSRVFEVERVGHGIAHIALNGFMFDTPEEAQGFLDAYVAEMGDAVLENSVDGADAGAMIVYRDNAVSERQYRSEGIAVRGNLAFWVIISSNNSQQHSGPMAAFIAGFAVTQMDALYEAAGAA